MHISEGILSAPVLLVGVTGSIAGIAVGLNKMKDEDVPRVAVLAAAFFIASLVHVPIGPGNVHLVLNGLTGLMLGWMAFPAIFVGLTLQALLFQFGGITTLGVNTLNMAFPAVASYLVFARYIQSNSQRYLWPAAFLCGSLSVVLSGGGLALCLVFTGESFFHVAKLIMAAHLPVMFIEGVITAMICSFIKQVRPELLKIV